jgi:hypothetical protein
MARLAGSEPTEPTEPTLFLLIIRKIRCETEKTMTAQISAYGRLVADPRPAPLRTVTTWLWHGWLYRFLQCCRGGRVNLLAGRYCLWETGRCAGKAPERRPCERGRQYAVQSVDRAGWRYTAGYQVVADSVISARTVRPGEGAAGTGNGRATPGSEQRPTATGYDDFDQTQPFDDETPF